MYTNRRLAVHSSDDINFFNYGSFVTPE